MKVFFLPLVSAKRFGGRQIIEKKTKKHCTKLPTVFFLLHMLFPANFYKIHFHSRGSQCACACHMLEQSIFCQIISVKCSLYYYYFLLLFILSF